MIIWWICYLCILLLQMLFDLAKQGMMRKFSGSWKIDSMYASEQKSQAADSESEVVGAWVNFHQLLEPAILPPWPLSRYVRGVSERIIREMCSDLQHECLRLSQLDSAGSQQWFCLSKALFTFFLLCATDHAQQSLLTTKQHSYVLILLKDFHQDHCRLWYFITVVCILS
jgi:hypothetical protein